MSKKQNLTSKQIKIIAKMHSAALLSYADTLMFDDCDISEKDQYKVVNEIHKIARKMAGCLPMNIGHTNDIIIFAKKMNQ